MTLANITAAMKKYGSKCNQAGADSLKTWFSQGNMFSYTRDSNNAPVPPSTEAFVHVYPGIVGSVLKMFVISANKDVSTNTNIANDVQVCDVSMVDPSTSGNDNGGIPAGEALTRILLWKNNYQTWIDANAGSSTGIFKAFQVPNSDTTFGNQHNGFLALQTTTPITSAQADLIVQDSNSSVVEFFDTSIPVPPIPSGATDFYLLGLAES